MMPDPQADQETPMYHCWKAWNCNLYKFYTSDLKERLTRYFWVHFRSMKQPLRSTNFLLSHKKENENTTAKVR